MSTENKKELAIGKINLILMAIAFIIIIIGFVLMTGSTTEQTFNADIFSTRRLTVGPMLAFFGFIAMIVAILWKQKSEK